MMQGKQLDAFECVFVMQVIVVMQIILTNWFSMRIIIKLNNTKLQVSVQLRL